MTENMNDTRTETKFASVEDTLNMHRTASNETTLVSEIPNIINEENVIIAPGQGKIPVSILIDKFCEEQAFSYLLLIGKFGFNAPRNIPVSQFFNQRLLVLISILHQMQIIFFFARVVSEQHHLCSSIKFAMHKIKPGTLTAGTVKSNFKRTIEKFVASDNVFPFVSSVKGIPAYWKCISYC